MAATVPAVAAPLPAALPALPAVEPELPATAGTPLPALAPEEPELPLTAALPVPADGVPFTPAVCDPSPAVGLIGAMLEALLSPQPEIIAAIHRVAIPNTCALFIARPVASRLARCVADVVVIRSTVAAADGKHWYKNKR